MDRTGREPCERQFAPSAAAAWPRCRAGWGLGRPVDVRWPADTHDARVVERGWRPQGPRSPDDGSAAVGWFAERRRDKGALRANEAGDWRDPWRDRSGSRVHHAAARSRLPARGEGGEPPAGDRRADATRRVP